MTAVSKRHEYSSDLSYETSRSVESRDADCSESASADELDTFYALASKRHEVSNDLSSSRSVESEDMGSSESKAGQSETFDSFIKYRLPSEPSFVRNALKKLKSQRNISYISILGRGVNGIVIRALDGENGRELAIKIQPRYRLQEEVHLWESLEHPNLVPLFEKISVSNKTNALLMPVLGPSMDKVIGEPSFIESPSSLLRLQRWLWDIACAIDYLHQKGICHGDIKPDNILIKENNIRSIAVLSDFTFMTTSTDVRGCRVGYPPLFCAPEVLKSSGSESRSGSSSSRLQAHRHDKLDIWAFGITVIDVLDPDSLGEIMRKKDVKLSRQKFRMRNWYGKLMKPYLKKIKNAFFLSSLLKRKFPNAKVSQSFVQVFAKFIAFVLKESPNGRPSSGEVLRHEFFSTEISDMLQKPFERQQTQSLPCSVPSDGNRVTTNRTVFTDTKNMSDKTQPSSLPSTLEQHSIRITLFANGNGKRALEPSSNKESLDAAVDDDRPIQKKTKTVDPALDFKEKGFQNGFPSFHNIFRSILPVSFFPSSFED